MEYHFVYECLLEGQVILTGKNMIKILFGILENKTLSATFSFVPEKESGLVTGTLRMDHGKLGCDVDHVRVTKTGTRHFVSGFLCGAAKRLAKERGHKSRSTERNLVSTAPIEAASSSNLAEFVFAFLHQFCGVKLQEIFATSTCVSYSVNNLLFMIQFLESAFLVSGPGGTPLTLFLPKTIEKSFEDGTYMWKGKGLDRVFFQLSLVVIQCFVQQTLPTSFGLQDPIPTLLDMSEKLTLPVDQEECFGSWSIDGQKKSKAMIQILPYYVWNLWDATFLKEILKRVSSTFIAAE